MNELSRFPNLVGWINEKADIDCRRSNKDVADYRPLGERACAIPTNNDVDAMCVITEQAAGKPSMGFYRLKELYGHDDALDCLVTSFGGVGIDSVLPALDTLRRRIDQLDTFALTTVANGEASRSAKTPAPDDDVILKAEIRKAMDAHGRNAKKNTLAKAVGGNRQRVLRLIDEVRCEDAQVLGSGTENRPDS